MLLIAFYYICHYILESDAPYKVGIYFLSIDAFIKDAKAYNEIFLDILKEGFKQVRWIIPWY